MIEEHKFESLQMQKGARSVVPPSVARMKKSGPGSRFVEVPAEAIRSFLEKKGMKEDCFGNEVVYTLENHNCRHITVRVFTSIACGDAVARDLGEDAIRTTAWYERTIEDRKLRKCVYDGTKILRTGSVEKVLARIEERMREAYRAANAYAKEKHCMYEDCIRSRIDHRRSRAARKEES
jgi:hypothetical protein